MNNDKFILDLFSGEMRSNCAVLREAFSEGADAQQLANAARSLKSSAKLLGFARLAALFAKLEAFFDAGNLFDKGDKNAPRCMALLESLSQTPPEEIENAIDAAEGEINECAAADFAPRARSEKSGAPETEKPPKDVEIPNLEPSMKELFLVDVSAQCEVISNTLVELEGDFSSKKKLEALMRASHSIKGAARAVGIESIVALTHQMENCFSAALADKIAVSADNIDAFFKCSDFILELCRAGFESIDLRRSAELMEELKRAEAALPADPSKPPSKPPQPAPAPKQRAADKAAPDAAYVRISIGNINSIMALAAESLIENRKFEAFKDALASARQEHGRVLNRLEEALNMLGSSPSPSLLPRLELVGMAMREQSAFLRRTFEAFSDYARKNVQLSSRLYSEVLESRMRPFSDLAQRFPKMVRDFSKSLSKSISFEISGASVPIDRDILEKLDAPITHILRNACDHGIETPRERADAGKSEPAKISMKASHSSGMFLLSISDNGRGVNTARVKEKILERKLAPPEILAQMQEDEIFEFLFLPAFTTKDAVTEISGRGVGLDVVQTMLREVGGSVEVSSEEGRGCTFTLKLPITRSVLKSLLVDIDSQPYAFALSSIYRAVIVRRADARSDSRGRYFMLDKKRVNLVDASRVLGFGPRQPQGENLYVAVVAGRGRYWGFEVDGIPAEAELVVRALNTSLGKIACVSAAALGADGMPILILDIDDILIYAARVYSGGGSDGETAAETAPAAKAGRVLVVDDSATVREVERKILENAGYAVDTAVDGADGWNLVRLGRYDMVVSDVDMPRMSGFELVSKIRKIYPSMPVVIVSYKDRREDEQRGLEAGANAYLAKTSFQDDTFLRTVNELIGGR